MIFVGGDQMACEKDCMTWEGGGVDEKRFRKKGLLENEE